MTNQQLMNTTKTTSSQNQKRIIKKVGVAKFAVIFTKEKSCQLITFAQFANMGLQISRNYKENVLIKLNLFGKIKFRH